MTCVDITRDVMAMTSSKDLREIRAAIDAKYAEVGRSTPTILPP